LRCAEVAVDTLTGEIRVLRADLVQDCGRPLNPLVDLGQIEGGTVVPGLARPMEYLPQTNDWMALAPGAQPHQRLSDRP
jgi:xanthine dehydrogenase molybdopterin-binding subunit B